MKKCRFIAGFLTFVMAIAVFASPLAEYLPIQGNSLTASAASNEYAMFPLSTVNISQGEGVGSHYYSYALDLVGDTNVRAPFTGKIVDIDYNNFGAGHRVVLQSLDNVVFADGTVGIMTIKLNHDNDISDLKKGQIIKQGEIFYQAGKYGNVTGTHVHIECAKGAYAGQDYLGSGENAVAVLKNRVHVYNALWLSSSTSRPKDKGYNWKVLTNTPIPEPSSRFSVSIDKITDNNAIINFVAYKKTTESTKSFSIKVWETNNSSNSKSFSFNSSYPNVGKTQNTGLSFDLKNEVKFLMKHATKYSFTITSNYTENGANRSYTSSTYSFATTGSHSYGSWTTSKAATCTASGTETRKCSCGATETRTIAAKGHSYSSSYTIDKYATCTESGSKSRHCTVCGAKTDITSIPATGHNFGSWITTEKATCTESGVQTRYCNYCSATETRKIDALGHNFNETVVVPPTSYSEGYTKHTCSRCGSWYTDNYTDVLSVERVSDFSLTDRASSSLTFSWNKVYGATGYMIQIYKNGKWIGYNISDSDMTSYTVSGLSAGTKYKVRICAMIVTDTETVSGAYNEISAITSPSNMNGFKLHTRGIGALKFSWSRNTSATGYQLQIYKGGKWVTYNIKSGGTTAYVISGLSAGTKYNVRIRPMKTINGTTVYGSYKTITAITSPSNMSGFKLHTRGIGALKFSWSRNTSATGYQLQIYKGGKWVTYNIKSGSTTAYVISGLSAGTRYNVRIRPMKTISGTTVYGSYKTITAITAPKNMSGFKLAAQSKNSLKIGWSKNASATGYQLQIYKGGKWVTYTISGNTKTSYTVKSLSAGTKYKFRIRAYKKIGTSTVYGNFSATKTFSTKK